MSLRNLVLLSIEFPGISALCCMLHLSHSCTHEILWAQNLLTCAQCKSLSVGNHQKSVQLCRFFLHISGDIARKNNWWLQEVFRTSIPWLSFFQSISYSDVQDYPFFVNLVQHWKPIYCVTLNSKQTEIQLYGATPTLGLAYRVLMYKREPCILNVILQALILSHTCNSGFVSR